MKCIHFINKSHFQDVVLNVSQTAVIIKTVATFILPCGYLPKRNVTHKITLILGIYHELSFKSQY
jgi:hypothetical protein